MPLFSRQPTAPGTLVTIPAGETEDEGWFNLQAGFNLPVTTSSFLTGNIAEESDLDNTPGVHPLEDADLVALEGRCVCAVVYDSDVSINFPDGGVVANLQGATLGLTAFEVTETLPPGGLPESGSSSSLRDVVIELADPTLVPQICGDVHADNMVFGDLSLLKNTGGDFTAATQECMEPSAADVFDHLDTPPSGEAFWLLTRRVTGNGEGTYDSGNASQVEPRDDEIEATGICP